VTIIEERLAFVEGRVTEQSQMFADLREAIGSLERRMDHRFEQVDARFAQVDARFAQVDARFAQVDARFAQVDARFAQVDARFLQVEARLDQLGGEMSKNFRWIVGIQITTLITVVATLLGAFAMR
jgi:uncharacterized protein (DUF3084 family)